MKDYKKYKLIKETVEYVSEINDLSLPNRDRFVSDCRFLYFGLSRLYLKDSYHNSNCSFVIKRHHSSGLHNSQQFDLYIGKDSFKANDVYKACREVLDPILLHRVTKVDDDIMYTINKIEYVKELLEDLLKELQVYELIKASKLEVTFEQLN